MIAFEPHMQATGVRMCLGSGPGQHYAAHCAGYDHNQPAPTRASRTATTAWEVIMDTQSLRWRLMVALLAVFLVANVAGAQTRFSYTKGQSVTPAFEGW